MKPYKKYKTTAKSNFISGYSTMCVILIAFFLMFSVLASAMANKSSLAGNIIAQEDSFEAALIPRPRFAPDNVVRIQLDALANNDQPYRDAGIEVSELPFYCGGSDNRVEFNLLLSAWRGPLNHHKTAQTHLVLISSLFHWRKPIANRPCVSSQLHTL